MIDNSTPKKSLGQHWLYDEGSLSAMCDAASIGSNDTVLEIGPGLGTLTEKLVKVAKSVIAVEFDTKLAQDLPSLLPAENLMVIESDILKFDFSKLPVSYKIVANIPYYLTSNLIRVVSETSNPPSVVVLLVQREVAQRVAAGPGNMSILAVTAQFYFEVSLGKVVKAELFTPAPKVDSQVLVLNRRKSPLFMDVDDKQLFRLVKAGFSQKRKTLSNALSAGLAISKDEAIHMLNSCSIDPNTRAQQLSLSDWKNIYFARITG